METETAIPFEDLIIELYNNQKDKQFLLEVENFIIKNKEDYSLVYLHTLVNTIKGYLVNNFE